MNNVLLSNEVIIYLFAQSLIFVFSILAFYFSLLILKKWDFDSSSSLQYKLEKRSYLVILIISFTMIAKILLLPYFVYALDNLSNIVPGAMCAAGIVTANEYGQISLFLKIFVIFFVCVWLIVNSLDLKAKTYPYTKKKYYLYTLIFFLIAIEIALDFLYFSNIPTAEPVVCCSTIYGVSSATNHIPFNLDIKFMIIIFYLIFALLVLLNTQKSTILSFVFSVLFLYISYYSVTYFFSTYIYELPTHQCPFCMLQKEYNFIGYFLWASLLIGTFMSMSTIVLEKYIKQNINKLFLISNIFLTIFVGICTFYVVRYYLVNGVFL